MPAKTTFTYIHPSLGPITHEIEHLHLFQVNERSIHIKFDDALKGQARTVEIRTSAPYLLRTETPIE